jgi:hypothetical protein
MKSSISIETTEGRLEGLSAVLKRIIYGGRWET